MEQHHEFIFLQSLVDEQDEHATYDSMATTSGVPEASSVRRRPQRQISAMSESEAVGPKQRSAFQSILAYIMKQSYAAALIVMMVKHRIFVNFLFSRVK